MIQAFFKIKEECQSILNKDIFQLHLKESVRIEEFKTIQESQISQFISYLKTVWVTNMISLIKEQFNQIGKGWFNIQETNKLTYEFGKLKRFLTVVRLQMQDVLYQVLKKNLEKFN